MYQILEDVSMLDSNIDITKNPNICEECLAEFILDVEGYIETKPTFKFSFTQ